MWCELLWSDTVAIVSLPTNNYTDFQRLCAKVSKRTLDGAHLRLERLECTDSILVENLHPSTTEDMLSLYFESGRGGGEEVTDVQMVAEGIARVSFKDFECKTAGPYFVCVIFIFQFRIRRLYNCVI